MCHHATHRTHGHRESPVRLPCPRSSHAARSVLFVLASVLALLLSPSAVTAQHQPEPLHNPSWRLQQAWMQLQQAEQRLAQAQASRLAAQHERDAAYRRAAELPGIISQERAALTQLDVDIQRIRGELDSLNAAVTQAEAELQTRLQPLNDARAQLDAARQACEQAKSQAIAAFEASDEFVRAESAARESAEQATRAADLTLAALKQTPQYQRLAEDDADNEATVRRMRADPSVSQVVLANASQRWITTRSALNQLVRNHVDTDDAVQLARRQAESASDALKQLREDFARRLPDLREVAAAGKVVDEHQHRVTQLSAHAQTAQHALSAARNAHNQQGQRLADAQSARRVAEQRLQQYERALANVQSDLARAHDDLSQAARAYEQARAWRDQAHRIWRDILRQESHPRKPLDPHTP